MTFPAFEQLKNQLDHLNSNQSAFIAGYLWAKSESTISSEGVFPVSDTDTISKQRITILSGSQTGNARGIAEKLHQKIPDSKLYNLGDYKAKSLPKEEIVLLITSTQGEGEPPEEAIPFYRYLTAKKSPKLENLRFAVLGLGDSSYPDFCQAAKDFDQLLEKHGGNRLIDRVDADLSFEQPADQWINDISQTVDKINSQAQAQAHSTTSPLQIVKDSYTAHYHKNNPFTATVLNQHSLVDVQSDKETFHVEIDLADSGITYQPGDTLGVIPKNAKEVVKEIIHTTQLDETTEVTINHQTVSLIEALSTYCDLNQLTPQFINHYENLLGKSIHLTHTEANLAYLIKEYPINTLTAQALIEHLKPLTPRLYSIASSQSEVDEEVHLCVGAVSFTYHDKNYYGSASHYLSQLAIDETLDIFVEPNPRFRLPEDTSKPIIMIGAGTGIAPFRSFIQEREASEATGENWLFFGNRNSRLDFLYQGEWIKYRENGSLTRCDLAWSRQGESKTYVQHKLLEQSATIWEWLEKGAHIYVCGDAKHMAKDVEKALLNIIETHSNSSSEESLDYLDNLRQAQRYQRDVY